MNLLLAAMFAIQIGPSGTDAPAKQPQMAVRGSMVALTFGAGNSIYFSLSTDSGRTFSEAKRVVDAPVIPLTRHRGPRIAFAGDAIVITAVWGGTNGEGPHAHGLPPDGDLFTLRSADMGKTWSRPAVINDVPGAATEGLHALASDGKAKLFAAWLDNRGGKGKKLYGSQSSDGGVTWSKNVLIYESPSGTICECCHPSLAIEPNGEILVMWRNWLDGSRDMYLARSRDGVRFSTAGKLGAGTWKLNACPMDGGGIAVAGGKIATAWRRERQIFLASPGATEMQIGEGTDVAIAGSGAGFYAAWSTAAGIRVLRPGSSDPALLAPRGSFPSLIALPGGAVVAWEDSGKIAVEQLR
ncbi:MAG TPA: sialidase family protein [Bryobacteraceae bacterium]|jgi:hypothetical protein|nr:sialidase family protein [Bryobacteraceae bacterium]